MTIVEQIRAEVERLKETAKLMKLSTYKSGWNSAMNAVLQLLSTLEKEHEKPSEGLEEELVKYIGYPEENLDGKWKKKEVEEIARHFAQWGAEHAREQSKPKVNEGLEEEIKSFALNFYQDNGNLPMVADIARHFAKWGAEHRGCLEIPNDLEEASDEYAEKHGFRVPYDGSDNFYDDVDVKASKEGFIAGAKWQKEQMMKGAVEVIVQPSPLNGPLGISAYCCNFPSKHPFYHCKEGDNVRIIIVKEG